MSSPRRTYHVGCSLNSIGRILVVAVICFGIYRLTRNPIDYVRLYVVIIISVVVLFMMTPWFELIPKYYSSIITVLVLLVCGGLSIYFELKERPMNYAGLFSTIFSILLFLFVTSSWSKNIRRKFPPLFVTLFTLYGAGVILLLLLSRPANSLELFLPIITITIVWIFLVFQYMKRPRDSSEDSHKNS